MKRFLMFALAALLLAFGGVAGAQAAPSLSPGAVFVKSSQAPDVVWLDGKKDKSFSATAEAIPYNTYIGPSGVAIRSFSQNYASTAQLKQVYNELMNNTVGEEIAYLSYVDLIPGYPMGYGVAGMWYGQWSGNQLAPGRKIEIYDIDNITFDELSLVLAHEYGHHFTYYCLINKEGVSSGDFMDSEYARIRKLASYPSINNGEHRWSPAEIAADDYVQLFGSPNAHKSVIFEDIRDSVLNNTFSEIRYYNTSMYNLYPQENPLIPLAAEVNGLHEYWLKLSGRPTTGINKPPSPPVLALTSIKKVFDDGTGTIPLQYTFEWTKSYDDTTSDMEYTLVFMEDENSFVYPVRTTTDSRGRQAILGAYTDGNGRGYYQSLPEHAEFWVQAKDKDGKVVRSAPLYIDFSNSYASLGSLTESRRLSGVDAYETAAAISKAGWDSSSIVILASGEGFADGLAGAPLAYHYGAPLLLTRRSVLPKATLDEIKRLGASNVYILGGLGVIAESVANDLRSRGYIVTRICGQTMYDTAASIAKTMGVKGGKAVLVTSAGYADALSIGPVAARNGWPILFTTKSSLPTVTKKALIDMSIKQVDIIGGPGVIGDNVVNELKSMGIGVGRVYGEDKELTSLEVAKAYSSIYSGVAVATGYSFADALAGAPFAAKEGYPLLLVSRSAVKAKIMDYIKANKGNIKDIYIFGGTSVISDSVMNALADAIKP